MDALAVEAAPFIHPHALVEDATIGPRTRVWQFASVIRGASIGAECSIGSGATIDGATIGNRCSVAAGAFLPPGVELRDDVFVGPGAVFCNDAWPSVGKDGFDLARLQIDRTILVERGASIGAGAIVLPGVRIGAGATVAAGVVVCRDVGAGRVLRRDGTAEPMPERVPGRMRFVV